MKDMDLLVQFGLQVFIAASPIFLALISWAAAELARLINAKVKNEALVGTLLRLNDAVATAVRETEQVTVNKLKAAAADGKLTSAEIEDVKKASLNSLYQYLGPSGVQKLHSVFGFESATEVKKFLTARVERHVHELK